MEDKERFAVAVKDIATEFNYAREKYGVSADNDLNTPSDFTTMMVGYGAAWSTRAGFRPYKSETLLAFRTAMVKAANVAISAIVWIDTLLAGEIVRPDVLRPDPE